MNRSSMNEPPSERRAKGRRPKRRTLTDFTPSEAGSVVKLPTGGRSIAPVQPGGTTVAETDFRAISKIGRAEIAPERLQDQEVFASEVQNPPEIDRGSSPRLMHISAEASRTAIGQSSMHGYPRLTLAARTTRDLRPAALAVAACNERTRQLIADATIATFDLTHSLLEAKGPIEVAKLTTYHLRTLSELLTQYILELGSIAGRWTYPSHP